MDIEERLIELEIKVARQDDLVDTLNQTIYRQQKKLDELEALCAGLARRFKELSDMATTGSPINEKPPHY